MLKIKSNITVLFVVCLIMSGCGVAETLEYENQTFKDLYPEFNISDKKYSSYMHYDILFSSEIKAINFDAFLVWLGFRTHLDSAEVFIDKATIIGNGLAKNIAVNELIELNENLVRDSQTYDLRSASYKLLEIESQELDKYVEDDKLAIEVTYHIHEKPLKLLFEFERKTIKRVIFPT